MKDARKRICLIGAGLAVLGDALAVIGVVVLLAVALSKD